MVIGELLPQDFEYDYPENLLSTRLFDRNRHDLMIATQARVGYVIETMERSGPSARQCLLLSDERINGVRAVKRLMGIQNTELRDRLFYYNEFGTCDANTKNGRWSNFMWNIRNFRERYL